jgi:hypothetical protein
MAKLEFALVVAATGVITTLALDRLAGLQALGRDVQRQTAAAQQRAASALALARCPHANPSPTPGATSACP